MLPKIHKDYSGPSHLSFNHEKFSPRGTKTHDLRDIRDVSTYALEAPQKASNLKLFIERYANGLDIWTGEVL